MLDWIDHKNKSNNIYKIYRTLKEKFSLLNIICSLNLIITSKNKTKYIAYAFDMRRYNKVHPMKVIQSVRWFVGSFTDLSE